MPLSALLEKNLMTFSSENFELILVSTASSSSLILVSNGNTLSLSTGAAVFDNPVSHPSNEAACLSVYLTTFFQSLPTAFSLIIYTSPLFSLKSIFGPIVIFLFSPS